MLETRKILKKLTEITAEYNSVFISDVYLLIKSEMIRRNKRAKTSISLKQTKEIAKRFCKKNPEFSPYISYQQTFTKDSGNDVKGVFISNNGFPPRFTGKNFRYTLLRSGDLT